MQDMSLADQFDRVLGDIEDAAKADDRPMPAPLYVSVQRKNGTRFGQTVLSKLDVDDFIENEADYANKVGPGHYACRITAVGSRKALGYVNWEVMPSAEASPPPVPSPKIAEIPTGIPAQAGGGLDPTAIMIAAMNNANQQTAAMVSGMMQIAAAAMNRSPQERTSVGELAELWKLVRAEASGPTESDDSLGRALADSLPAIVQAFGQASPPASPTPRRSPDAIRPAPPSAPAPRDLSPDERVAAVLLQRVPDLGELAEPVAYVLCTAARLVRLAEFSNVAADDAAVTVIETIGGDAIEQIAGSASATDLAVLLRVAEPRLSHAYAVEVAAAVLEYSDDEGIDDEPNDDERAPLSGRRPEPATADAGGASARDPGE